MMHSRRSWCWKVGWVVMGIMMLHGVGVNVLGAMEEQAASLRPKWVEGQVTRYELWTLRRTTNSIRAGRENRSITSAMEFAGEATWRVERVQSDGGATCEMVFDWVSAQITMPNGQVLQNDSRQTRGEMEAVHGLLRAMTGVPLRLQVAADGTMQKVEGVAAMVGRVPKEMTAPSDDDFLETASDLATLSGVPEELEIGRSWNAKFNWKHELGRMHYQTRYTLASVEEVAGIPLATVNATAKLRLNVDRPRVPAGMPVPEIRMTQSDWQSQIMWDVQRGQAVGRNTILNYTLEFVIRLPSQTVNRTLQETIQNQVLRIAED